MSDFQQEKNIILEFYQALDAASPGEVEGVLKGAVAADYIWRGFHPFDVHRSAESVATTFWGPLKTSLTSLQRRMDIFFAGCNQMDDFSTVWVVSMGHLTGLFDAPWLGITPTRKILSLIHI